MELRPVITAWAALGLLISLPRAAGAQQAQASTRMQGIMTDRLKPHELRAWKSIREIVLAKDQEGRPLYPHLYNLYSQAETGGHPIYIKLQDQKLFSREVGKCEIELQDSGEIAITISLNLFLIDCESRASESGAFIPFAGLGRRERYAEVLGHELAHAVRALQDPEYFHLYQDLTRVSKELDQLLHKEKAGSPELDRQMDKLLSIKREIEKPAEAAEAEIWRELCRRK